MSIIWVFIYTYIIVWFTYDITQALELKFSVIPMLIYPFGVSLRDGKKFQDFEEMIKVFKSELPDQEVSLAETYSPQIFQMTGCAGFAWMFYILVTGKNVRFFNDSIQYQVPILVAVVLVKYVLLLYYHFKTQRKLFKANVYLYMLFLLTVLLIEYKEYLFA